MAGRNRRRMKLLGLPVDCLDMPRVVEEIFGAIADREGKERDFPLHVVTINPEMAVFARGDSALKNIICSADLIVPDGMGVVWAGRLAGNRVPERVAGIDLMLSLLREAAHRSTAKHTISAFFLGGAPGVASTAARRVCREIPELDVIGTHHGYFNRQQEEVLLARLDELKPELLFVGLGVPRQEKWIRANRRRLPGGMVMGVGGSFDVLADQKKRAPQWMQSIGLEWAYRLYREPRRIKRMMALPLFVLLVIKEHLLG